MPFFGVSPGTCRCVNAELPGTPLSTRPGLRPPLGWGPNSKPTGDIPVKQNASISSCFSMLHTTACRPLIALACLLSAAILPLSCPAGVNSDFINPPLKFRARPLWFWNNTAVNAAEVEAQLRGNRDRSGYGGLAPLPFGDKFTPKYLSEDYFKVYGAAVNKARELGMFLTLYDEYGFPSGSGGANMGDGIPRFKQKHPEATLRRLDKHEDTVTGPSSYLPELSYRTPRYADGLPDFNIYIARLNVLLQGAGRHVADIAVLYPIATLQAGYHFDGPLSPYSGGVNVPEADYVYLGELLATRVCRDFTFLHPEVLDERCSVKGDRIRLNNRINREEYRVLMLPGQKTIRWSNLKTVKKFFDSGGQVIATGQLPCKSAEFGHDADVVAAIQAMFPKVRQQILATASSEWRESGAYEAAKAIDGVGDTRWAPSDEQSKDWWLEVNFGTDRPFNSTRISEAFNRVTGYRIEYWNGSAWAACASGTTLGSNKVDRFNPVTASRVRLSIDRVSSGTPSICEFETHLDDGPNLAHSDALVVQEGRRGARAIYVNSPNESNLRQALDRALPVYDVNIEGSQKLRYLHKVTGKTEVYFFSNPSDQNADALVRLRGKVTPDAWDPHTGQFSKPQYSQTVEYGQPVTRVQLTLKSVRSLFLIGTKQ